MGFGWFVVGWVSRLRGDLRFVVGMPGRKRTDQISRRDLEVLDFVARFGVVPRNAVETWAATGKTTTSVRERRLREAGLVEVRCGVWGETRLLVCTRLGLRVLGRAELRPARFSLGALGHDCAVAELGARLEKGGERVMSEREMLAWERVAGGRVLSAELSGGRVHRADLAATREGGVPEAIEVELAAKGATRLDELLRGWRRAVGEGRLSGVVYWCAPRVVAVVARAVERTRTGGMIRVEEL